MSGSVQGEMTRRRAIQGVLAAGVSGAALLRGVCRAATANPVTRVEEDWALQIGTPDTNNTAPMVKTVMSAQADLLGYCAFYDINYEMQGSPPKLVHGGFGIEMWNPNQQWPDTAYYPSTALLKVPNEVVIWTQQLDLNNGVLSFSVWDASSLTWGVAPGRLLNLSKASVPYADLSGYTPTVSVAESGPTWYPQLVTSLKLKTVRYYDSGGAVVTTDSTGYQVYPSTTP